MDLQQLTDAIKSKYPQSGLTADEIKGLASCLLASGLVTDENAQSVVDSQAESIKGLQSILDRRFADKRESLLKAQKEELEKTLKEQPNEDDVFAKMSKLLEEKIKPISDKLAEEDKRRSEEQRTLLIVERAKANGIPEAMARMLNVPNEVSDLDGFFKDKAQELKNLGLQTPVPPSDGNPPKTEGERFAEQIRAGIKK